MEMFFFSSNIDLRQNTIENEQILLIE